MNSAMNAQRSNRVFFFVSLGFTALLLAASGIFLVNLLTGGAAKGMKVAEKACMATLRANGFNPNTSKSGELKVNRAAIEGIEPLVYQSGVLIANCPAYTLTEYCAGSTCPNPGVSFTLKLKD